MDGAVKTYMIYVLTNLGSWSHATEQKDMWGAWAEANRFVREHVELSDKTELKVTVIDMEEKFG
jgi:hypothetical protein